MRLATKNAINLESEEKSEVEEHKREEPEEV